MASGALRQRPDLCTRDLLELPTRAFPTMKQLFLAPLFLLATVPFVKADTDCDSTSADTSIPFDTRGVGTDEDLNEAYVKAWLTSRRGGSEMRLSSQTSIARRTPAG